MMKFKRQPVRKNRAKKIYKNEKKNGKDKKK